MVLESELFHQHERWDGMDIDFQVTTSQIEITDWMIALVIGAVFLTGLIVRTMVRKSNYS